jgi:NADPH:quinone reductase-like Zn-dependent oxidoreductase
VTDSHIEKFLEKRCDSDIRDLPQRVKVAIAMSSIHSDSQDPEGTLYTFMGNMYKQLNKQGAFSVLQQGSGVRSVLSQLIEKLAPAVFKCAVADSFDLWEEEERNTWNKAVQKIAQIARDTCIEWPT